MSSIDSSQSGETQQPRGIGPVEIMRGESADSRPPFMALRIGDGWFRRFVLERSVDETGVSGVGVVAWGVVLPTGRCVMQWRETSAIGKGSIGFYDSLAQLVGIHGHKGATVVRMVDRADPVFLLGDDGVIPTAANEDEEPPGASEDEEPPGAPGAAA